MAKCDSYDFGECTWYVCSTLSWVPDGLGNAADWYANAQAQGYDVGGVAVAGAVVVFGAGHGYSDFGHVAIVETVNPDGSFLVSEMNYSAWDVIDRRTTTYYDALGFVYPPSALTGSTPSLPPAPPADPSADLMAAWARLQDTLNNILPTETGWTSSLADQLRDLRGL